MKFQIITIFPEALDAYFNISIIRRAREKKIVSIKTHDLRKWTSDKRRTVDDAPYGGGAGMVMKVEPIYKALRALELRMKNKESKIKKRKVVLLSAKGKKWDQGMAKKYAKLDEIILICGRYEGVDERVVKLIDEEISIGDYVLIGGEIGAMAIADSVIRLIPGVLGNADSLETESHSVPGYLEYPHYTRPKVLKIGDKKYKVPKVLLSGNHKKIEEWRKKHGKNN